MMINTKKSKLCPCIMVIFGAGGDLSQRKLIPAIYNLGQDGLLPDNFAVVGFARKEVSDEEFRKQAMEAMRTQADEKSFDSALAEKLIKSFYYVQGDSAKIDSYNNLRETLKKIDAENKTQGNFLYYLATPPKLIAVIPKLLKEADLVSQDNKNWRRIIIEKPFGNDLQSAKELNRQLGQVLGEDQIYRIDHYLGKETVQNMMVFRFANGIFEPIWNRRYIDSVQISVAETLGVEGRGGYYDNNGALRDMVPNHLFQLLSHVAMEPPNSFSADDVRDEKVKALKAVKPFTMETAETHAVRGQYGEGEMNKKPAQAYRSEEGIAKDSNTETFAALKLEIDNWRWGGVPFYLRTGKRMPSRCSEVIIEFRAAPLQIFQNTSVKTSVPNRLRIQIQPEERITLSFAAKKPGISIGLSEVEMNFDYADYFGKKPNTGYETLLYDCMNGDATLFQRSDQIEVGWKIIDSILKYWEQNKANDFPNYAPGTSGPLAADELITADGGRQWSMGC